MQAPTPSLSSQGQGTQIKDRIKELRRVKASELLSNPSNWRRHPASQGNALRGVLTEIGYADALITYETPEGLMLIDGHLRAETTPDTEVPVLVTDLTPQEADMLLATLDPLAAMATTNEEQLVQLLDTISFENQEVLDLLDTLRQSNWSPTWEPNIEAVASIVPMDTPITNKVVVECPALITGEVRDAIAQAIEGIDDARLV